MKYALSMIPVRILLFFCLTILLSHCDGSDPESEEQRTRKLLTGGTWKINSVTVGGVNKNDLFADLTITFSGSEYTATNGEPVWPQTGTWNFTDNAKTITRNDDVRVSLDNVTETELTLSLTWTKTTLAGGRIHSVAGEHVFSFTK
jgi:hypothetical protein